MPKKKIKKENKKSRNKETKKEISLVAASFNGENVFSNKKEAMTLYDQSRFGEKKDGKIIYSVYEALYLLEKGKMEIKDSRKKIKFEKLIEIARETDPQIRTKYIVFKNMRNRGFIVKTALKFGAEFRVYDRGVRPGQDHARWILFPVSENSQLTWHDFSAKNRVAHSTKKNLLIAVVDEEEDCTYYQIQWLKP
jgi:tRNA-intron endonuclease